MEILDCKKAEIEKFDDSVVLIEFKNEDFISVDDLEQIELSVGQLIGNHSYSAINILPQGFKNFTFEGKNFVTNKSKALKHRSLDCYISGSLARRLELEVFFQLHKPTRKTKIFNSLNKALTYIEGQKD